MMMMIVVPIVQCLYISGEVLVFLVLNQLLDRIASSLFRLLVLLSLEVAIEISDTSANDGAVVGPSDEF
jgi:hypothetical protein